VKKSGELCWRRMNSNITHLMKVIMNFVVGVSVKFITVFIIDTFTLFE